MAHPPALILHGHFYQPPRENPWTDTVEVEPSAHPFPNWNERIYSECYRPNAYARIMSPTGDVRGVVNNYALMSFNFGPTLLRWLQRYHPRSYERILVADRLSLAERGHGNAIAQGYNHTILPLCNDRDLRTQVRWGIADFRHRFKREPEALWLPETACDHRTLDVLIEEGMRFALLAPGQVGRIMKDGQWHDADGGSVDTSIPYRYEHRDGSGRSIALFFYDGGISRAIAFEGALASSEGLIERFQRSSRGDGSLAHAVTDGESYGHHHRWGERCLSFALRDEAKRRGLWVTNYGALLDVHPPTVRADISLGPDGRGTSWSCAHGVGRWWRDCGCHTGGQPGWNQAWRTPLRSALDRLRDRGTEAFEDGMAGYVDDPWQLRDDYVDVLLRPDIDRREFLERKGARLQAKDATQRALTLLEMQRSSMLMYTSCGWFFNDVSGIETLQILRYAGRMFDQLRELGLDCGPAKEQFLGELSEAKSNHPLFGSAADLYRKHVEPSRVTSVRVAAHLGLSSLVTAQPKVGWLAGFRFEHGPIHRLKVGRLSVQVSRVQLESVATSRVDDFAAASVFFGAVDLHCVLMAYPGAEELQRKWELVEETAQAPSLLQLLRTVEAEFGDDDHGLDDVLPGHRQAMSEAIFSELRERYAKQYDAMYRDSRQAMAVFHETGLPLVDELREATELTLNYRLGKQVRQAPQDRFMIDAYEQAEALVEEAVRFGCKVDTRTLGIHLEAHLLRELRPLGDGSMGHVTAFDRALDQATAIAGLAERMDVQVPRERVQECLLAVVPIEGADVDKIRLLSHSFGVAAPADRIR